ncbi:MAG: 16S rRNA (uracil(1498)-N(3))-methyltransferase [bacterium]|nr:16S rRNA (uracil(1498)-N(3))-methyltransferase [bacterium]
METRRFFSSHPVISGRVLVTGDELHHLKTVNRAKNGDTVEVFDGKGTLCSGEIRTINAHEAIVAVAAVERRDKPPVRISIAPSLIKKKAMHLMVEKLAELGVDEIRPVIFARTDEKYSPAMLKKWQKIALQSLKVNKKLWATVVYPPVDLPKLVENTAEITTKVMLHMDGETGPLPGITPPVVGIVGPPGDFLPREREWLKQNGFIEININDGTLKTETAAIAIAALLNCNKDVVQKDHD